MNTQSTAIPMEGGGRIHFVTRGDGPTGIIYLHAMAADAYYWRDLWDAFAPEAFRHVSLDLRGHGESTCPPHQFTNEQLARDALAVADAAGLDRFHVVGHSLGGKVGMLLAAFAPERVGSLILLGTPGPGFVPFKREDLAALIASYHDLEVTRRFFAGWFNQETDAIEAWLQAFSRYPDWLLQATAEVAIWTDITPAISEKIRARVLAIAGADDPVYGPAYQQSDVLPFLPGVHSVEVTDCGHGMHLEQPRAIATEIDRFLRSGAA